ncbi:MAG: hypothetical protein ACRD2B_04995, partial [Terriglobia bacterium]
VCFAIGRNDPHNPGGAPAHLLSQDRYFAEGPVRHRKEVYPLRGGFKAWQRAGLPVEAVPPQK